MLPNKKHPMLIAEYFSSENIYKSVFKLKKKNKYNASLVNYTNNPLQLDSPNGEIEKCKARAARKKSIKSIMKRRFGKRNTTESATQNSGNLEYNNCDLPSTSTSIPAVQFMEIADSEISECNTTPIEEMSSFSGINDLDISDITYHKLETTIESINR
ncbi:uncharacterized protein LOC107884957 isoform X1 [Acyrthosiphon pisum]|uniref:Uncharacterized protein n=1 Tax=Acyrthosiphon pisum TaxID=7029 RepID=A0A8R2D6F1_ACYPI|nr:uncharacterized protein LOC107884957 isoform X1 [Acyrthosiphon pisum]|eukprot:XP_016663611.1 PREDICTED: uncharacterized protein LOC107884957 isoform X1 [Acyrthosiphon pisum]